MNIHDFTSRKKENRKISMVTCYDTWSAKILAKTEVDSLLVGDSLAMVMHGHSTTLPATIELMALHTAAVARGAPNKFIIGDLPFLSYRGSLDVAMNAVSLLMRAGAHAVKLEGVWGHEEIIKQIVGSGVPVMGHIGLTPQSIYHLGGFKVQGRDQEQAKDLLKQAHRLQVLGCFSIVLECVPSILAQSISKELEIPTIGIGAGLDCDGQVLVLHDLLGVQTDFKPKFLRHFLNGADQIQGAVNQFHQAVVENTFPNEKESYS